MSVNIWPKNGQIVIMAQRRSKIPDAPGYRPTQEDTRYWTGSEWTQSIEHAKVYADQHKARADGEPIKIWNLVSSEWQT